MFTGIYITNQLNKKITPGAYTYVAGGLYAVTESDNWFLRYDKSIIFCRNIKKHKSNK